jgi:hypothetical protein
MRGQPGTSSNSLMLLKGERKMKRLLVFVSVMAFLAGACTTSDSKQKTDLSKAQPGDKVTLSGTLQFNTVPNAVIPYGAQPALQFSDLALTPNGDFIDGKVNFTRTGQDDYVLVAVLSFENEMLFGYFDPNTDLNLHLPSGTVLLGIRGLEISGSNQGTVQFSLTGRIFSGYSVFGEKGTAYVFAVPGKVNPSSTLPGDQIDAETFQANSNVLAIPFDLNSGN